MFVRNAEGVGFPLGEETWSHNTLGGVYKEPGAGGDRRSPRFSAQLTPPASFACAAESSGLLPGHEHHVSADFFLHLWGWLDLGGFPHGWGRRLCWGESLWGRWEPQYLSFFCQVCLLGVSRGLWGRLQWRGW